jgi:hypothetical protein
MINIALNHLKKGGTRYYYAMNAVIAQSYIGFLYYLFTLFHSMQYYPSQLMVQHLGLFVFKNYRDKSGLNTIVKQYIKHDPSIGMNSYIHEDAFHHEFCKPLQKQGASSEVIYSIVSSIHPNFMYYLHKIFQQYNNKLKRVYNHAKDIDETTLDKTLLQNIQECIKFCQLKKIPIHPMYTKNELFSYTTYLQQYFIKKPKLDFEQLRVSVDTLYTLTSPDESYQICDYIKRHFKSITGIIDSRANNGPLSILLSYEFKEVYACEIDPINYDYLVHNIGVYKRKNITTFKGSVFHFMKHPIKHIKEVCLWIDYTTFEFKDQFEYISDGSSYMECLNLFLSTTEIQYVCLKIPIDTLPIDYQDIMQAFTFIKSYEMNNFYVILLMK